MRDFLDEIVQRRRRQPKSPNPPAKTFFARTPHLLRKALTGDDGVNIIGEFKRASPSRGVIRENASPAEFVALYERAGVAAISILTEPEFFRGSLADLRAARATTSLPILQKDFIVEEFQIEEAAAAGADAILLIVAALRDEELTRLRRMAEDQLGLDALVEVHTAEEMRRAENCGATLIGVNNRDLRALTVSIATSLELADLAPTGATLVSESGISSPAEIARLRRCGYRGFLIGESLMRCQDPVALIHSWREGRSAHHHV
jgi:indole-3-glycerol phosphate synthase